MILFIVPSYDKEEVYLVSCCEVLMDKLSGLFTVPASYTSFLTLCFLQWRCSRLPIILTSLASKCHLIVKTTRSGLSKEMKSNESSYYQTHGSVSAAKKARNREPHTSVLFTCTLI